MGFENSTIDHGPISYSQNSKEMDYWHPSDVLIKPFFRLYLFLFPKMSFFFWTIGTPLRPVHVEFDEQAHLMIATFPTLAASK